LPSWGMQFWCFSAFWSLPKSRQSAPCHGPFRPPRARATSPKKTFRLVPTLRSRLYRDSCPGGVGRAKHGAAWAQACVTPFCRVDRWGPGPCAVGLGAGTALCATLGTIPSVSRRSWAHRASCFDKGSADAIWTRETNPSCPMLAPTASCPHPRPRSTSPSCSPMRPTSLRRTLPLLLPVSG
jgi:hypothetical protein